MSARKRQLFKLDDVVDLLMNGTLPDASTGEENHPVPNKRASMTPDPIALKGGAKVDSSKFYSSPKPNGEARRELLKAATTNSPLRDSINSKASDVQSGRNSATLEEKITHSPLPSRASLPGKLERFDSPKTGPTKWATIFLKPSSGTSAEESGDSKKPSSPFASWLKKAKDKPGDAVVQPILDAGQKEFGVTQCKDCGMVYELKSPDDELLHMKHHDSFTEALLVNATALKNCVPVKGLDGGLQIYQVSKESAMQKALSSKCDAVIAVANSELRRVTDQPLLEKLLPKQKAYICVNPATSHVTGLCVAEPAARAYPSTSTSWPLEIDRDPKKTIAGIRLLWVAPTWRRKGIAKSLMECVRSTFVYGCVLSKREIAICPPTLDGFNFFRSYIGGLPSPKSNDEANSGQQFTAPLLVYDV